ncbi:MAG: MMPL family transporter [Myxococcales bacterium]|nr:MMPL family transporter [Myxococcales bacterium]
MRALRPALLLAVAAIGMAVYCALHLRLGTDITRFLPVGSRSELAALSSRLMDSPLTRTVVISVGADELSVAIAAARDLAGALRDHPEVAWVRTGMDDSDPEAIYRLYFDRRLGFLSDDPERELPERLSDAALHERARELRRRLASPAASFFEPLAASDPLGAFEGLVMRMRSEQSTLRVEQGQLVTPDGRYAILLLGTLRSAFDSGAQGRLLADLQQRFESIRDRRGSGLAMELSAAGRFAVAAEKTIKSDVYLIAACSFVGVALLFVMIVASLRGFLITAVPPLTGILVATTLGLWVFGNLDGLTMVFGASLMGVAIDYSNHLLLHHGLARPPEAPERTARRLRPSLVLGALTTVASFVGFGIAPFPAFREMAFFATVCVLTGLGVSLWVLPGLLSYTPPLPNRSSLLSARLDAIFRRLGTWPRGVLFAPVGLAAAAVFALPSLQWSDDLSRLTQLDPALVDEDRRVRERVAGLESSRFVIGMAGDGDAAVALSDAIHARLQTVVDAGDLDGVRSLHGLIWSEALQRRNRAWLAADPLLYTRLDAAFRDEGFRPDSFRSFGETLAGPPAPPLRLAELQSSPLAELLVPFVFDLGDRVAVVAHLRGIRNPDAVRAALDGINGVFLLDQRSFANDIYREFRETSLRQIGIGAVLVVLLLFVRYRTWRPVVAAFLPSALVAVLVLAALALLGVSTNLFHVISLVMVLGMGVDYGIFCVDSASRREGLGATLTSLLLSCLTTALVFGTLALSSQPSLRAIGVTTGLGILLSYVLAPVTLAAMGLGGADREPEKATRPHD